MLLLGGEKEQRVIFRQIVLLFTVCMLCASPVLAQSGDSWPPHPEDLFAAGVEVHTVQPIVDNEDRTLSLWKDDDWDVFLYPDDSARIMQNAIYQRPDSTWLIIEQKEDHSYHTWQLDPLSGAFELIPALCDSDDYLNNITYRGPTSYDHIWVYFSDSEHTQLCSPVTGHASSPLPSEPIWGIGHWDWQSILPAPSPDGTRLILMGLVDPPEEKTWGVYYAVYSYEIATDTLLYLGTVGDQTLVDFGKWVDNTHFTITVTDMPEWSGCQIYVGDATQPESIEFAAGMLRFYPQVLLDPPIVQKMDAVMKDGANPSPCWLGIYDFQTMAYNTYDTGDLCEYGVRIPDGSGDRLYRSGGVVRFNPITGHRRGLFTGEIEHIHSLSPGGSYAVIGFGNNRVVDVGVDPNSRPDHSDYYSDPEAFIDMVVISYVIMDLTNGTLIERFPEHGTWFTDNMLLVTPPDAPHQLVTLNETGITETSLPGLVQLALPERSQLLLENAAGGVDLYTVATQEMQPIINPLNDELFLRSIRQVENLIQVEVAQTPDGPTSIWYIRLPE